MMEDPYLAQLPKTNKHYQTLTWTQSQQTASSLQLYEDYFYANSSMTSAEIEELHRKLTQTRSSRIREALFPDTSVSALSNRLRHWHFQQKQQQQQQQQHPAGPGLSRQNSNASSGRPAAAAAVAAGPVAIGGVRGTVSLLADAAVRLKHAIIAIINYEEDVDCAGWACGALVPLLMDAGDPRAQLKAVEIVRELARKQASRAGLANDERLIPVLVDLLASDRLPDAAEPLCAALEHLSRYDGGSRRLFLSGGIPALVRMLGSPRRRVVHYALCALRNLLLYVDEAKREVRLCDGVRRMDRLLWRHHDDPKEGGRFLAMDIDCLHLLAVGCTDVKSELATEEILSRLGAIVGEFAYEKLWHVVARLLRALSAEASLKPALVKAGMIGVIGAMLTRLDAALSDTAWRRPEVSRVRMACLWVLRNLSDKAYHVLKRGGGGGGVEGGLEVRLEELVMTLLNQLDRAPDHHVITCCAGILCNLTCQNTATKECVVEYGGVEALTHILVHNWDRDEIVEPVLCALTHLTRGHTHDHAARSLIPQCPSALSSLVRLIGPRSSRGPSATARSPAVDYRWPIVRAGLGLVYNLALETNTRTQLRQEGLLTQLPSHLEVVCQACGLHGPPRSPFAASSVCGENASIDGVAVEDLLECLLLGLTVLMKDNAEARLWLLGVTPSGPGLDTPAELALRILGIQPSAWRADDPQGVAWSLVLRAALAFLAQLSVEPSFAASLQPYVAPLLRVLHEREVEDGLALPSAAVLYRVSHHMSVERGAELRKELDRALGYSLMVNSPPTINVRPTMNDRSLTFNDSGYGTSADVDFNGETRTRSYSRYSARDGEWVAESGV